MVRGNPSKRVWKGGGKLGRVCLPTGYLQVLPPSSANHTYELDHPADELDHPMLFREGRASLQCFAPCHMPHYLLTVGQGQLM